MAIWSAEIKELEKLSVTLKGQVPDLEKEVIRLIKADDENMILLYSRRCLEVIITDLCERELKRPRKTEPLKGIIEKLNKEGLVPSHIITSMDGLNSLSTYGVHPKDFDPEQLKPVLSNLAIIIKWYLKYKASTASGVKDSAPESIIPDFHDIPAEVTRKPKKNLVLVITGIILIIAVIIFTKLFSGSNLANIRSADGRISIAVMPFQNMTNDTTWNIWQDGIQDILITSLSGTEELKVRQAQPVKGMIEIEGHVNNSMITPAMASKISKKLDSEIFINGNIKQAGKIIRVNAQLTNTRTKEIFKSFQIEGVFKEEMIMRIIDSLSAQVKNFILVDKLQKKVSGNFQPYISTNSPEAYRYYIHGAKAMSARDLATSSSLLQKAIAIDSNFIWASYILSYGYYRFGRYDQAKELAIKLYRRKDQLPPQQKLWVNYLYSILFGTPDERLTYLAQLEDFDDQSHEVLLHEGLLYCEIQEYEKAIPPLEKALKLYDNWGLKPEWIDYYEALGKAYNSTGRYGKEKRLYKKAEKDFSDNPILIGRQMIFLLSSGDIASAEEHVEKYISIRKKTYDESYIMTLLGDIFSEGEQQDKAEEYYRKSVSLQPENPFYLNYLARFLIDKDRNIKEGLDLIEKALEISPDYFSFLTTKGWGLYKQGKYKEALGILEKSWELKPVYSHRLYLALEEAKKAVN